MSPVVLGLLTTGLALNAAPPLSPEQRAIHYLSREVPRWAKENGCYSCHNNGDAARALYLARRMGKVVAEEALADTTRWMSRPEGWDHNGGEGPFNDRKLARLQFAATLVAAQAVRERKDARALEQAARLVAGEQERDGSWKVAPDETIGSPATQGTALATHLARQTLTSVDARRYRDAAARADRWLRRLKVETVMDAAAVLMSLGRATGVEAERQRRVCLEKIRKGESRGGGWGPYVNSGAEVFDTALVVLALSGLEQTAEVKEWLKRGRAYLIAEQQPDGSWDETTRPSGSDSYAQKQSTAGWALMALLATR